MAYKKLHKEIEIIINSRLENILSQVGLSDEDKDNIFTINGGLSNINSKKKNSNISGYNLFCREMFPEVKIENNGLATKDMLRIIASMWKELDQENKNNYNSRAKLIKPKTKQEKKLEKVNAKENKQTVKTINKNVKDSKLKISPKTSSSKLSSVKSTPAQSDNEQSGSTIKKLLAKLKSPKHHDDDE